MKAVVVEIRDGYASVLSEDGCIVKTKDKHYEVGQIIYIKNNKNNMIKKISTIAASAAAILILGVGSWAYASPYSYVSIDVNPSIEFVLNRFDRVIYIRAINEEADGLLHEINLKNLKHKTIANAIHQTFNQITDLGYFDQNSSAGIVIAAAGKNPQKSDELAADIKEEVQQDIVTNYDNTSIEAYSLGMEDVEAAKELGVTPGKLNLVNKMISSSDESEDIDIEEWLDKPVKEIMNATKKHHKDSEETKEPEKPHKKPPKDKKDKKDPKAEKDIKEKDKKDKKNPKIEEVTDKDRDKKDRKHPKAEKDADKEKDKIDKKHHKAEKDANKEKDKKEKRDSKPRKDANKHKKLPVKKSPKNNRSPHPHP